MIPVFLTTGQIISIHERMISEFGGPKGIRDLALLDSAAQNPPARFEGKYLHKGLAHMAAAYLFHLCRNHPFVDGNKRTALASALVFLELNGMGVDANDDELEKLVVGVADGSVDKPGVKAFFKKRIVPAGGK